MTFPNISPVEHFHYEHFNTSKNTRYTVLTKFRMRAIHGLSCANVGSELCNSQYVDCPALVFTHALLDGFTHMLNKRWFILGHSMLDEKPSFHKEGWEQGAKKVPGRGNYSISSKIRHYKFLTLNFESKSLEGNFSNNQK